MKTLTVRGLKQKKRNQVLYFEAWFGNALIDVDPVREVLVKKYGKEGMTYKTIK